MRALHPYSRRGFASLGMTVIAACAMVMTGCSNDDTTTVEPTTKAGTFVGEQKTLGGGSGRSWAVVDSNGNPTSVGITLNEAALAYFGSDTVAAQLVFKMPTEATNLAYDHVSLDWNPTGHPPEHLYDIPHFDVHFYTITQAERQMITGVGADSAKMYKQPEADYIPTNYFLPPGPGVPNMGIHWLYMLSPELDTAQHHMFDKTFIYGFYNGSMCFMEPMVTLGYLQSKPNVTVDLMLPAKYPKQAYFATKYSIKYDATAKEYTISLDGLTKR